ncbi:hypothetical protein L1987_58542 [Smallanthus sonchifolius]|uniref:Uncharacterized protein n=1 Tax=Smallanthus sonchifolius TaxID=185202 RepID=A0ACB9DG19_9ASTR|nr:hypothetical protein L1987_58542 [Smallanthus sonchifolius]
MARFDNVNQRLVDEPKNKASSHHQKNVDKPRHVIQPNKTGHFASYALAIREEHRSSREGDSKTSGVGTNQTMQKIITLEVGDSLGISDSDCMLLAQVRDVNLLANLYIVCHKEGFLDVQINYVGGLWVWLKFKNREVCNQF